MLRIVFLFVLTVVLGAGMPLDCAGCTFLEDCKPGNEHCVIAEFTLENETPDRDAVPAGSPASRVISPELIGALAVGDPALRAFADTCTTTLIPSVSCLGTPGVVVAVLERMLFRVTSDNMAARDNVVTIGATEAVAQSAKPLTPVPEPWTLVMVGGGLILLGTLRRSRPH